MRHLVSAILASVLAVGSLSAQSAVTLLNVSYDPTRELYQEVNAAFAAGSTEGFLACCAEDVAWTMVGDTTVQGKDAIRQWMTSMGPMEPPS